MTVEKLSNSPHPHRASETRRSGESPTAPDRKSTRLNSSHLVISYAVFCLKKKKHVIVSMSYCLDTQQQEYLLQKKLNLSSYDASDVNLHRLVYYKCVKLPMSSMHHNLCAG